ncbi:MAG: acetoacetyl-CoA reductase/3-oxoacyl-[acyl-carrier protein] reductase [Verrucomicrobia bacterium]|jgi:NAD(P)-dependent dehydrogenase (short-subunit alcohol dehydrogenase family)|nr:MAG: acetoacetyl-CoA reductase/3-oxoacyl-[acyl-carrier protein] reductase [Verrucomicrobiota bacterium]
MHTNSLPTAALAESQSEPEFVLMSDWSLQGRTALVTGGSRGIGRAIALSLASLGADVAITCYTGCKFAADVTGQIKDLGRRSMSYSHDIAKPEEVEKMARAVLDTFPDIDIVVNNAGITRDRSFKKMTYDMWHGVLAVNLTGVFSVTRCFIDGMADRGWGRVINISSIIGEAGGFGQANYAAAKAGVIALTKTLALEYARKGVTVNAIAPGFVSTRMTAEVPERAMQSVLERTPVGRLAEPREIAAAVSFLSSPLASYITGHVLDVNGGMLMR